MTNSCVCGNYAETVLLYHRDGEGKMVMLSAQWYALALPEIIRKDKTIQIFALVDLGSHSP